MCIRDSYLYREGMTPCTRRVMLAIDDERTAVREALGYGPPHYGLDPTPGVYEVFVDYFGEGSIKAAGYNMQGPLEVSDRYITCLLYTSPSPRDRTRSRMPSS